MILLYRMNNERYIKNLPLVLHHAVSRSRQNYILGLFYHYFQMVMTAISQRVTHGDIFTVSGSSYQPNSKASKRLLSSSGLPNHIKHL